jgi:PAB1-binding protein PBP1
LGKDVSAISVVSLDLKAEGTGTFKTDGAISGAVADGSSRRLEKWDAAIEPGAEEVSIQFDRSVCILYFLISVKETR